MIYPYLLRDLSIERENRVWATDICYIPMAKGFMYLVAIMDRNGPRFLDRRLSVICTHESWPHHAARGHEVLPAYT